ncbi:Uncharacterised protein [Mycobacteroides abscessus subsp. abscessus]|nr:Uncharacterised protein [Mycobacteroides abscessus subsp. abscessus]
MMLKSNCPTPSKNGVKLNEKSVNSDRLTTPVTIPIKVPAKILIKKLAGTFLSNKMTAISNVNKVVNGRGSLRFPKATKVPSLPTIIPPSFNPRNITKNPIATLIPETKVPGMAEANLGANLEAAISVNKIPTTSTTVSACGLVSPKAPTNVKAKNALSLIPGVMIKGEFARKAISKQPTTALKTVATVTAP